MTIWATEDTKIKQIPAFLDVKTLMKIYIYNRYADLKCDNMCDFI